ncbi:MAG: hypothetical protein PHG05_00135 [Candidatus Nanoarchaeia archaeon]|nr:hypothetical protein [Candidatus Nanoarchaeia archaeon]
MNNLNPRFIEPPHSLKRSVRGEPAGTHLLYIHKWRDGRYCIAGRLFEDSGKDALFLNRSFLRNDLDFLMDSNFFENPLFPDLVDKLKEYLGIEELNPYDLRGELMKAVFNYQDFLNSKVSDKIKPEVINPCDIEKSYCDPKRVVNPSNLDDYVH